MFGSLPKFMPIEREKKMRQIERDDIELILISFRFAWKYPLEGTIRLKIGRTMKYLKVMAFLWIRGVGCRCSLISYLLMTSIASNTLSVTSTNFRGQRVNQHKINLKYVHLFWGGGGQLNTIYLQWYMHTYSKFYTGTVLLQYPLVKQSNWIRALKYEIWIATFL